MTKENLTVLWNEIDDERYCVCPFNSNDFSHPIPKPWDQAVQEDRIYQIEGTTVGVKVEAIRTEVHEIEECSIHFEPFHRESKRRRCLVQEEALGHKNHRICEEVQNLKERSNSDMVREKREVKTFADATELCPTYIVQNVVVTYTTMCKFLRDVNRFIWKHWFDHKFRDFICVQDIVRYYDK